MKFTPEQENAIGARGRIIVSASAGSGKTAVMIERLVSLILGGTDVREVLALTFTNKAAAQMRDRLRTALSERLAAADERERARLKDQLNALPLAEIGTIHAFCGRLVRTNFYLCDTDASFSIVASDDAVGSMLQSRALDAVFEEGYATKDPAFFGLLDVYFRKKKDKKLRETVRGLYGQMRGLGDYRERLTEHRPKFEEACAYLQHGYQKTVAFLIGRLEEMRVFFAENKKVSAYIGELLSYLLPLEGKTLFEMTAAIGPFQPSTAPSKTKMTGESLENMIFLGNARKKIKDLYADLGSYSDETAERLRNESAEQLSEALSALLLRFDDEYARLKKEANVLDYNDLEHFALKVLSDGDALAALKRRYKYVFVDEYQDVNRVQERILSLIAGEEVFLVGDSKQAIYGFRGSNSAFFDEKRAAFRAHGGDLPLNRNFRSAENILSAVNRVFTPLIDGYGPMTGGDRYYGRRGEVKFHRIVRGKKEKETLGVYSVLADSKREKPDEIATYVADLIEEEVASSFYDVDKKPIEGETEETADRVRKTEFKDIAVLVRKHSAAMGPIVRELNRRGIPVSASSAVNICDFAEARMCIDWLSLIDNAEQDAPLASALLSAVGGFTEDELAAVRIAYPEVYTFRDACKRYAFAEDGKFDKKTDPIAVKLGNFFVFLRDLRLRAQAISAADVLSTLLSMGLETQIAAEEDAEALSRIRRLIALCENMSVHEFLAELKENDYELDYAGGGGENAVQTLTMHSAKGLEFPVVILADLDVPFHGPDKKDVLFTEQLGISAKAYDTEKKRVYMTVSRRASRFLQAEEERLGEKNLLYVAMTRAKYRLHMLFEEKDEAISPDYANRLSDFIDLKAMRDLFAEPPAPQEAPLGRNAYLGAENAALTQKLRAVYRMPYPFAESSALPLKSSATDLMRRTKEENFSGDWGPVHTKEEGLAYHAFLQHVGFGKSAGEELKRMEKTGLLTPGELKLLNENNLGKILSLPCFAGIAEKRVWREQTFLTLIPAKELIDTDAEDEILFQGAIDLLVEDKEGFTVIDYKFSGRSDEHIREAYALQIKLYKKAVARIMGVREESIGARIVNIALLREIRM